MYETILDALRRNATAEALTLARALVAAHPGDAQAHHWLASALQQSGDPQAALVSIDEAIKLAPEQSSLHVARASLLINAGGVENARSALAAASSINPNEFDAYAVQAQVALGLGDLDEAARLSRLASRIDPDHPQLAAIDGMLALRRGDATQALQLVSSALRREPQNVQLRYAMGFIYMEQGHWAFAEQSFRSLLDTLPASTLVPLIADLMGKQDRHAEGADELAPLLANPEVTTPALSRFAGLLRIAAGQPGEALPLLVHALSQQLHDPGTLGALVEIGRDAKYRTQVLGALEGALATAPDSLPLWQARIAIEPVGESAHAVFRRWTMHMPQSVNALKSQLELHLRLGEESAANLVAKRILALDPDDATAQSHIIMPLFAKDPDAAVAQIRSWLSETKDPARRLALQGWLGQAQNDSGLYLEAADTWVYLHAESSNAVGLPPVSAARQEWPDLGVLPASSGSALFLWGLPGSGVERLAAVMAGSESSFRGDRLGPTPPSDGLQDYAVVEQLANGQLSGQALVNRWRETLPLRGIHDGVVIDWLAWWDNAFLLGLRPGLREGLLVIAIRDPRDMLLEWLAFGSALPFSMSGPLRAAGWMSFVLDGIANLVEQKWYPCRVVRTDHIADDPNEAAAAISDALQQEWPVPASVGPRRFPTGHWRNYAQALAGPFALLTPVAVRLGYTQD